MRMMNIDFNHYDLENHHHSRHLQPHSTTATATTSTSTTTNVPLLRLKNERLKDGKLSPTLIITLPKKRKSNDKSRRRFPFLKAIVNSFISSDRRTTSTPAVLLKTVIFFK